MNNTEILLCAIYNTSMLRYVAEKKKEKGVRRK